MFRPAEKALLALTARHCSGNITRWVHSHAESAVTVYKNSNNPLLSALFLKENGDIYSHNVERIINT